jgi:hypothetical protein
VVYVVLAGIVALVSKKHQARELLGYSAIAEEPSASPAA